MSVERFKSLGKDILWYGVSNMLYSLVQLLAMPIVVRNMTMNEVANWNILLPTGVLLSAIVTFGMDSAIVRFVIDKVDSQKKIIYSTGLLFVACLSLFLTVILWLLAPQFIAIINFSPDYLASYWILLFWLPGVLLAQLSQNWLKYTFQRSRFISVIASQSAIYLVAILFLKFTHQINLQNVMTASVVSVWIAALLGLCYSRTMLVLKFDIGMLAEMLRYGTPFMLLAFGFNFIFSVDKYLLAGSVSQAEFAVYSQAFRIAAIFSMIVSSFNFAFGPFSLSLINKEDAPDTFACLRTVYLLVMCLVGLVFISFDKVALLILAGENYIPGYTYIPLFVFGYILYGLFSFAQIGMIYSKKSHLGIYALLFGLIATIGFDFLTISTIKGYGTAIGFSLGNLVMVLMASYMSKKYYKIKSNTFKDTLLLGTYILGGLANPLLFTMDNVYAEGLLKSLIYIALFSFMFCLPPFMTERSMFRQALSRRSSHAMVKEVEL